MLDTVVMTTEHLTPEQYEIIQNQLQYRTGVEPSTGEVKYVRYVASLAVPATGANIRLTVDTSKWVKEPGQNNPYRISCKSLRIEGSIHKSMHGHNVYGGCKEPSIAFEWMITTVSLMLSVELPSLEHWWIRRVDWAECFDLRCLDNVRGWIRAKSLVVYPRRDVHFWGDMGFSVSGTTTELRSYAKGPQFHKEGGYQALLKCRSAEYAFDVSRIAERTLRCEIEIKPPSLEKLALKGRADEITRGWLEGEMYDKQWRQFLRPIDSDSRVVHTAVEVADRLQATFTDNWLSLYVVWCVLAIRGEGWYRSQVPASTWRHQRAKLEKASVSWESTNVLTIDAPESLQNFFPTLAAIERMTEVLPLVS